MEYRGVEYTVIVDERGNWQWAVSLGNPKKIKSGQAATLQSYSGWSISGPVCYTTPPSIIFAQAALSFFETDALHRCSGLGQADPAHFPALPRDRTFPS
jgi:hypothetical protein